MICTHTYVGMPCSKFDSSVENIGKHCIVVVVYYTMLYYAILLYYIHLFPVLRGFRITRGFSGTKMRVTRGLGVFKALSLNCDQAYVIIYILTCIWLVFLVYFISPIGPVD